MQVERQIDQMVKFIKQEAEEKANEISVSAEEVGCCVTRSTRRSHRTTHQDSPEGYQRCYKPPSYSTNPLKQR